MLGTILNWLSGGIADKLLDAYKAKLADGQNADAIAADIAKREIEARQAVAVAQMAHWFTALPILLLQLGAGFYLLKIWIFDAALGLGTTDALKGYALDALNIVVAGMAGQGLGKTIIGSILKR